MGPSWCQRRSGGRLGVDFGWILASIWEPLGLLFSIFLDANFKSKKGQLPNSFFVGFLLNFGSFFGYFFDICLTMLESCDLNSFCSENLSQQGLEASIFTLFLMFFSIRFMIMFFMTLLSFFEGFSDPFGDHLGNMFARIFNTFLRATGTPQNYPK